MTRSLQITLPQDEFRKTYFQPSICTVSLCPHRRLSLVTGSIKTVEARESLKFQCFVYFICSSYNSLSVTQTLLCISENSYSNCYFMTIGRLPDWEWGTLECRFEDTEMTLSDSHRSLPWALGNSWMGRLYSLSRIRAKTAIYPPGLVSLTRLLFFGQHGGFKPSLFHPPALPTRNTNTHINLRLCLTDHITHPHHNHLRVPLVGRGTTNTYQLFIFVLFDLEIF